MKRTIFVASAILGCVLATRVPFSFIPAIVAISLGAYMVVTGLLADDVLTSGAIGAADVIRAARSAQCLKSQTARPDAG
jgi:hypothetical protein